MSENAGCFLDGLCCLGIRHPSQNIELKLAWETSWYLQKYFGMIPASQNHPCSSNLQTFWFFFSFLFFFIFRFRTCPQKRWEKYKSMSTVQMSFWPYQVWKNSLNISRGAIMWLLGHNHKYQCFGLFYRDLIWNYFCY